MQGSDRGPIPPSYYQVSSLSASPAVQRAAAVPAGAWYRQVPGFRSGKWPKAVVALFAYLVIAAWLVQLPTNPALGILGILSVCVVLLAFNVRGIRTRLPVFRSPRKLVAVGGWISIGIAMLFAAAFAAPPAATQSGVTPTVAVKESSPSPGGSATPSPTAAFSPTPTPAPSPKPSPTPSPTPLPSPTPSPVQQPPSALTPINFLNAPLTAAPNQTVTLSVGTGASVNCTIEVDYASGPSTAQGLTPKTSSSSGSVSWTWKVGGKTTPGTWPITVTCGNNSASTTIRVT
jgi:hypothetical protein